jgi:hypothetical protein
MKRTPSERDPEGDPLPNVEDPSQLIQLRGSKPRPAGFGFVSPDWQPRQSYAGTYDAAWQRNRCPLLPVDFDPRFFQAAPADLIARGHLVGGEPVEVSGVSEAGPLSFRLPERRFKIAASIKGARTAVTPVLDTVLIEPDEKRVVLTWRATMPCAGNILYTEWVRVEESTG